MLLDINFLIKIVPNTPVETLTKFVENFNKYAPKYGITTPERISSFVGNCIVETGLKPIKELGNYKYLTDLYFFNKTKAKEFNHTSPQDAIDYSGKGYIQLTGKKNYSIVSQNLFGDDRLIKNPLLVLQPENALLTSLEWWKMNKMNAVSDKYGIKGVAGKINTGSALKTPKHLPQRLKAYNLVLGELKKKILPRNPFASITRRNFFSKFFSGITK